MALLTAADMVVNQILLNVATSLSIISCVIMVGLYLFIRSFRTDANKLVFIMNIYKLIAGMGTIWGSTGFANGQLTFL